jgi:hypothetical protein
VCVVVGILPLKAYAECIRRTACAQTKTIKECYEASPEKEPSTKVCDSEKAVYQRCKKSQVLARSPSLAPRIPRHSCAMHDTRALPLSHFARVAVAQASCCCGPQILSDLSYSTLIDKLKPK